MSDYDTTVTPTILVVRDLDAVQPGAGVRVELPRLPALEQWLALGVAQVARGGWRQWLQRELAYPALAALPSASIAAAAVPGAPADLPVWLAAPVHFIAGLDTVRVHPAGLLRLDPGEEDALARDFARVFAGSGWSLHASGRGELLLAGASAATGEVRTDDPALWVGADPREGLPRGPGAAPLRRLGAELEMWLHQHPVNESRAARGELPVNALWLWGGGASPARGGAPPDGAPGVDASADDLFVAGLARCAGWRLEPAPAGWTAARWPPSPQSGEGGPRRRLVVAGAAAAPDLRALHSIEQDWIAPALAQWRRGAHELTLLTAGAAVRLPRSPLQRAWRSLRRPRPWWQALPAC